MKDVLHKGVPEYRSIDAVAAKLVDLYFFTVPMATFTKHDVDKNSLDKAKMEI